MTPEELHARIVAARTPTVATEDALTVAKLHDLVIEYVKALDAWCAPMTYGGGTGRAESQLNRAERALRVVAGIVS